LRRGRHHESSTVRPSRIEHEGASVLSTVSWLIANPSSVPPVSRAQASSVRANRSGRISLSVAGIPGSSSVTVKSTARSGPCLAARDLLRDASTVPSFGACSERPRFQPPDERCREARGQPAAAPPEWTKAARIPVAECSVPSTMRSRTRRNRGICPPTRTSRAPLSPRASNADLGGFVRAIDYSSSVALSAQCRCPSENSGSSRGG